MPCPRPVPRMASAPNVITQEPIRQQTTNDQRRCDPIFLGLPDLVVERWEAIILQEAHRLQSHLDQRATRIRLHGGRVYQKTASFEGVVYLGIDGLSRPVVVGKPELLIALSFTKMGTAASLPDATASSVPLPCRR